MFAKFSTAVALFMLAAQVVASPPACLIAAISTTENPSDVKSICSSPSSIQSSLNSNCGSGASTAQNAFIAVCKDAGVTVSAPTSSSSSSSGTSTTSGQSSSTSSNSGFVTTTAPAKTGSGSNSGTTTGSSPSATGAASRLGMDIVGMAAIGVFAAMVAGSM